MTLSLGLWHWRCKKAGWRGTNVIGYQGVSYWVVPWGATQAEAGVKAEPDDGRWLGFAFGTTQVICYYP